MNVIGIPLSELREASWNPNVMNHGMTRLLRSSIYRNGLVENLVVRLMDDGIYQVLSGNQRLKVLRDMGFTSVPCCVVELSDAEAMLLAQALNQVHGEDDPGLRAELMRNVLKSIDEKDVLRVLPESSASLAAITSVGRQDIAVHLAAWQKAQVARLRHMTFQFTDEQALIVEEALSRLGEIAIEESGNPNRRSNGFYHLAKRYLEETDD